MTELIYATAVNVDGAAPAAATTQKADQLSDGRYFPVANKLSRLNDTPNRPSFST